MSGPNAGAYWPQPWTCEDGGPRRWGVAAGQPGARHRGGRDAASRRRPRRVRDRRARPARARRALRAAPRHPARRARSRARSRAGSSGSTPSTLAARSRARRACPPASGGRAASPPTPTATCTWCSAAGRTGSTRASTCSPPTGCRCRGPTTPSSSSTAASWSRRTATRPPGSSRRPSRSSTRSACCPVAAPLRLPEPSIARLSSDGESVIAVGTTTVFRLRLDRDGGADRDRRGVAPALRPGARAAATAGTR